MLKTYKYYYIYKIICLCGTHKDKYYIGLRRTNIEPTKDKYLGSGVEITTYFKAHKPIDGITHIKEILCMCNSFEELKLAEEYYIGDKYKTDPMCINHKAGGDAPGICEETSEKKVIH